MKYLYSIPDTFFYDKGKGDVKSMLEVAGDDLARVLVTDMMNHTGPCRDIVIPSGVDATIHQPVGVGEADVDTLFQAQ